MRNNTRQNINSLFDTSMEKAKSVFIDKYEFKYKDLSMLRAFTFSRTISTPTQRTKSTNFKSSSPPKTENFG